MRALGLWLALVTAWGAEPRFALEERPALPRGYWKSIEATAYCPCEVCTGDGDRRTANNTNTDKVPYNFAADRQLPMGTFIYVPPGLGVLDQVRAGQRMFQVDDRGGALDTEAKLRGVIRLDLRVKEHWYAVQFGRRFIPVYVVAP